MPRAESATAAVRRFLDGLPMRDDDDYVKVRAASIRAVAAQIDSAKDSTNPSILRSIPQAAKQLDELATDLHDYFAPPNEDDASTLLLRWIFDHSESVDFARDLVHRLGITEAERRFLANETDSANWQRIAHDLPLPTLKDHAR